MYTFIIIITAKERNREESKNMEEDASSIIERIDKHKITDTLNLSNRNLKLLPPTIASLTYLKYLYLDNNKLIFIPEIGNLIQLEDLSLENNELTLIPESFFNLKSLKSLNLSKNHLKCINVNLFVNLENLTILWLNHCELMYVPKEIGNLKNLERLGLKENCLQELPEEIGQLANLKWLNVERNEIYVLPNSIRKLKVLSHLNAAYNKIEEIPEFVYEMSNLYILLLRNNSIRKFNDEIVVGLSFLQKVDLRENPFLKAIKQKNPEFYKQILCLNNFITEN